MQRIQKTGFLKIILTLLLACFVSVGGIFLNPSISGKDINAETKMVNIATAEEFATFSDNVNSGTNDGYSGYLIVLDDDINLSGKVWTPIGNANYPFKGVFDGNGRTITGLIINSTVSLGSYAGLFGKTISAEIRNVNLTGVDIGVDTSYVGSLIGDAVTTKINNCSVFGTVKNYDSGYTGGLVGAISSNTEVDSCYSYASVECLNDTVGGLIGSAYNSSIKKCYYQGNSLSAANEYGITGSIDSTTIEDVFCNDAFNLYEGCSTSIQLTNSDNWIEDARDLMGLGIKAKVLKGVGNITLTINTYQFSSENYYEVTPVTKQAVVYSTATKYGFDNKSKDTALDIDFKILSHSTHESASYYNFTKIRVERTNGLLYDMFSEENFYNTYMGASDLATLASYYQKYSYVDFSINTDDTTVLWNNYWTYNDKVEYNKYNLTLDGRSQGNYKIDLYTRGIWVPITSNTVIYDSADRKSITTTDKITSDITTSSNQGFEGQDAVNGFYYSAANAWEAVKSSSGGVNNFTIPYNEKYTIEFSNANYLPKLQGFYAERGTTDPSAESMALLENRTFESTFSYELNTVGAESNIIDNFYFDNAIELTLNLNATTDYANVAGNTPLFTGTGSSEGLEISVLIDENLYEKGFAYNSGSEYIIVESITRDCGAYGLWGKFTALGIYYEDAESGDKIYIAQNGNSENDAVYGQDIAIKSIIYNIHTAVVSEWKYDWTDINETITVYNTLVSNNTYGDIFVKSNKAYKSNSTLVDVTGVSNTYDQKTSESVYFEIVPSDGFILSQVKIKTTESGDPFIVNISSSSGSVSHSYYPCTYTQTAFSGLGDVGKVNSTYSYELTNAGKYIVNCSNLIGIYSIEFVYEPKVYQDCELISSINAELYNPNSPFQASVVKLGNNHTDFANIFNNPPYYFSATYYDTYEICIKNVKLGYTVLDPNIEVIRSLSGSTSGLECQVEGYNRREENGCIYFTFRVISVNFQVEAFRVIVNVHRNVSFFNVNVEGLDIDAANGEFGLGMVNGTTLSAPSPVLEIIDVMAQTEDMVTIGLLIPEWVKIDRVDYGALNSFEEPLTGNKVGNGYTDNIVIFDFAHEEETIVDITIYLEVKKADFSIEHVVGLEVEQVDEVGPVSYGTKIEIDKNIIVSVSVQDIHENQSFGPYTFEFPEYVKSVSAKLTNGKGAWVDLGQIIGQVTSLTTKVLNKGTGSLISEWFEKEEEIILQIQYTTNTKPSIYVGDSKIASDSDIIQNPNYASFTDYKILTPGATLEFENKKLDAYKGYEFIGWAYNSYTTSRDMNGVSYDIIEEDNLLKICFNKDKDGYINVPFNNFIYITKIYRAIVYTVTYDIVVQDEITLTNIETELTDHMINEYLPKLTFVEYGQTYGIEVIDELPKVLIKGMYEFAGWKYSESKGKVLSYTGGDWATDTFSLDDNSIIDNSDKTVTFKVITTRRVVQVELYLDDVKIGYEYEVYGQLNGQITTKKPEKQGYNFIGWSYEGDMFTDKDGKFEIFDIQIEYSEDVEYKVRFDAVFEKKVYKLIIKAGNEGQKFPDGSSQVEGTIEIGVNQIDSPLFDSQFNLLGVPTWSTNFGNFEFRAFIFGSVDKLIIPTNYAQTDFAEDKQSYSFTATDLDSTGEIVLTAYYEMTEFKLDLLAGVHESDGWTKKDGIYSVIYDGKDHRLVVPVATESDPKLHNYNLSTNFLNYEYTWEYEYHHGAVGTSTDKELKLKTVSQSGSYYCFVSIESAVEDTIFYTDISDFYLEDIDARIYKKEIILKQFGKEIGSSNRIIKAFDGKVTLNSTYNVDYSESICSGDTVVVDVKFASSNVGLYSYLDEGIWQIFALIDENLYPDSNNYYIDSTKLYGKIIPYELNFDLIDDEDNFKYKIGDDDKKVNITDKYQINEEDLEFLSVNNFTYEVSLFTNKNIVGKYETGTEDLYFDSDLKVWNGAIDISSSFIIVVNDPFFIVSPSSNTVIINIEIKSNDIKLNETVDSSLAYVTVENSPESCEGNNTSSYSLIESKDYFKTNNHLDIKLTIESVYSSFYAVEKWLVLVDGTEQSNAYGNASEFEYYVDTSVSQITLYAYVTRLREISFDYMLVDNSEVDKVIEKTKVSMGETIQSSIEKYASQFPLDIQRIGWNFLGWKVNNSDGTTVASLLKTNLSSTVWSYEATNLVAIWEIADIQVDKDRDEYKAVYDGLNHEIIITIKSNTINNISLTYTYTWVSSATVKGKFDDTKLTVKDVKNSGTYTLRITAKSGVTSKYKDCTIIVDITPYDLFDSSFEINKEYDTTNNIVVEPFEGVAAEKIYVTGIYAGVNAGSLINLDSLTFQARVDTEVQDIGNYNIDKDFISENSQILKKEITLTAGNLSKNYSKSGKTVLSTTGTYTSGKINFEYTISTPKTDVGVYKDNELVFNITKGDLTSNFIANIIGTFEIEKELLKNEDVSWQGLATLTFDGKQHSLVVQNELSDIVKDYTYTNVSTSEVLDTEYAIYAGTYKVYANIIDGEINYEIDENGIYTYLTIETRTLGVSYDGEIFTKEYDGTVDINTFEATVTNIPAGIADEYKPSIYYEFVNNYAENNKEIRAYLDSTKEVSDSYVISQTKILGNILKRKINVHVSATKIYDGQEYFVVEAIDNQIIVDTPVYGEEVSGTISFEVKNCLEDDSQAFTSGLDYNVSLIIGTYQYDVNYEIDEFTYELYIESAELTVSVTVEDSYVYTGEPVNISYVIFRIDDAIGSETPSELDVVFTPNDAGTTLNDGLAVQVGSYKFDLNIPEESKHNFKFDAVSKVKGQFDITPKEIVLKFQKNIAYTGSNIIYNSTNYPKDVILLETTQLHEDDIMSWQFKTLDSKVGRYYLNDDREIEQQITVNRGTDDYTKNYTFEPHTSAAIFITQKSIDFSKLAIENTNIVYNSESRSIIIKIEDEIQEFTYNSILRENSVGSTELLSGEDIKYAGKYTLDIELLNYTILNKKPIVMEITPYPIDIENIVGKIEKNYDGNANVLSKYIQLKETNKFFEADQEFMDVIGTYDSKNAGQDKPIIFSLVGTNALIECSYQIITKPTIGNINAKDVTIRLDRKHEVYYNGQNVELQLSQFLMDGLIANDIIVGSLTLNKKDVGTYYLDSQVENINISAEAKDVSGNPIDITNYNIVFADDENTAVKINHAQIEVQAKDLIKVYNAEVQSATLEYFIYNGNGEMVGDFKPVVLYKNINTNVVDPVNVGTYQIIVSFEEYSNYIFVSGKTPSLTNQITLSNVLKIEKRKIKIDVADELQYQYNGKSPEYTVTNNDVIDPTAEKNNGLIEGHNFSAILYTISADNGVYSINGLSGTVIYKSVSIKANNVSVLANYDIIGYKATIVITQIGDEFETSSLTNLVYDGYDKIEKGLIKISLLINDSFVDYVYGIDDVFSDLKYEGAPITEVINAGNYSMSVNVVINESLSKSEVITFTVGRKIITYVDITSTKEYDDTALVLGEITSDDICVVNGTYDDVIITGCYVDGNYEEINTVGKHRIQLSATGADSENYDLTALTINGEITKRNVKVKLKESVALEYNNQSKQLAFDMLEVIDGSIVENQKVSGYILFIPSNAGTYTFEDKNINNSLIITSESNADVSAFYNFLYNGEIEITPKAVSAELSTIDLIYNGQVQHINSFIEFTNVDSTLMDAALNSLKIDYDKTVLNAGSYTASISSSTDNFSYTLNGYASNTVSFEVKVRKISIDIGNIEVQYNPTSNFETNLTNFNVSNIVEMHNISGTYKLYESGLGIGLYQGEQIIYSDLAIMVEGVNVINTNYKISNYTGSIKIVAYELDQSSIYLVNNALTYSRTDAKDLLEIAFIDANNQVQIISSKDTSNGTFVINEGEAINVGKYTVTVSINNYNLEKDTFEFNIIALEITSINYTPYKFYDGTHYVINMSGSYSLTSPQVITGDNISIKGYYQDEEGNNCKNVGKYDIKFVIENKDELPASNYLLNVEGVGSIDEKHLEITLKDSYNFVYKTNGEYSLDYSVTNFKITAGDLVGSDYLDGYVSFIKPNYIGLVDIKLISSEHLDILNSGESQKSNYNVTILGNFNIVKALVNVDFGNKTEFEYNAKNVVIEPVLTLVNSEEKELPNVITNYTSEAYNSSIAPINVGSYKLTLNLESSYYEFDNENTFNFTITQYKLTVLKDQLPTDKFFKIFGEVDLELLSHSISTPLGETISLYLTRESGEDVGSYDVYLKDWDNKNYFVEFDKDTGLDIFKILKASLLKVTILDTDENINLLKKEYDAKDIEAIDISTLNYVANGEIVNGTLSFEKGVNVGAYSLQSWNLTSTNFEEFDVECDLEFVIYPKEITVSCDNTTKVFDNSVFFNEIIKILDSEGNLLDKNTYPLTITGELDQKTVGDYIPVKLIYSGDSNTNYNLTNSLTVNIVSRNITITPKSDQFSTYGESTFEILYDITDNDSDKEYYGELSDEISGSLYIEIFGGKSKFIVGNYTISSNLTSDNLSINFVDNIVYEIVAKELIVTASDNFEKVYDGNANVIGDLEISGNVEGDNITVTGQYYNKDLTAIDATVSDDKVIVFSISGADAANYTIENVVGKIKNKTVYMVFDYLPSTIEMKNSDLIQNNETKDIDLIYGLKISDTLFAMPEPTHEGYTFKGWFFDEAFTQAVTVNTSVDGTIWPINVEEKTVYAKWEIKKFKVEMISTTRVNNIYVTDNALQGGTIVNISGSYKYYDVINLENKAEAKEGYEFIGYSDDILANVNEEYLASGYTVLPKDNYIYAKFKPKTIKITLNSNGGVFEKLDAWTFDSSLQNATIDVEFNQSLEDMLTSIPTLNKLGFKQDASVWKDSSGISYFLNNTTKISDLYYPEKTLYAVWNADSFGLILDANGGYFEGYDSSVWTVVEEKDGKAVKLSKQVVYNQEVGSLATPTKKGWVYDGFDGMYSEYVWTDTTAKEVLAKWVEDDFELSIQSLHGDVEVEVLSKNDVVIANYKMFVLEQTSISIPVKTTNKARVTISQSKGYEFASWTSSIDNIDDLTKNIVTINEFLENQQITANYNTRDNKITLKVNNANRGTIESGENKTTSPIDSVEFYAKTETEVNLNAIAVEGYEVTNWEVDSNGETYELSNEMISTNRTLSKFVSDIIITVTFEPKLNNIILISEDSKGLISIEDVVDSVNNYTYSIKTEETLVFTVKVKHGYTLDTALTSWVFETTSENKGTFVIESIGDDEYKISFSGFTSNGQIVVPFVNNRYTFTIISVYNNDNYIVDAKAKEIAYLYYNSTETKIDSEGTFELDYLTGFKLVPTYQKEGYSFKCWSLSDTSILPISHVDGMLDMYEDNSIQMQTLDNLTIYLIYEINEYTITYSVNDINKGALIYDNDDKEQFSIVVKHGRSSTPVLARATEHFMFKEWVSIDENGEETFFSNEKNLTINEVTRDYTLKAVYTGKPVTITINVELPQTELYDSISNVDFADVIVNENDNTTVESTTATGLKKTYVINTISGEYLSFALDQKNGYEYSTSDPYIPQDTRSIINNELPFITSMIYEDQVYNITMKAKTNVVVLKLVGNIEGAGIFEDHNSSVGIEKVEVVSQEKMVEVYIKTGGTLNAFINLGLGYKLTSNAYFCEPYLSQDENIKISTASIKNINQDMTIEAEISAYVYEVTFNYNYEGSPSSFTAVIEMGDTQFTPAIFADITSPVRSKYKFIGWSMNNDSQSSEMYYFDGNDIFTYKFLEETAVKMFGFFGTTNQVESTKTGIDYECNLYAYWELLRFNVDVVMVPNSAVINPSLAYQEIFPNTTGRKIRYADDYSRVVVGVSYVPESLVTIVAPNCYSGYKYYGWSYENEIIDIEKINYGNYSEIMGEQNIVVYLYYTIDVTITAEGNGQVIYNTTQTLYNGAINVVAQSDVAHIFLGWVVNSNQIDDKNEIKDFIITEPTEIVAVFVGEEVRIVLEQVDGAKIRLLGTENTTDAMFRVGDTVSFEIYEIIYGYYNNEWIGQYKGTVVENQYTIVPEDAIAHLASFKLSLVPYTISVSYVVAGGTGGEFVVDGEGTILKNKNYEYGTTLTFRTNTFSRYQIISLTVNGNEIDISTTSLDVTKNNHFAVDKTNEIKLEFKQLLWIDIYEPFSGLGTEKDPYTIINQRQLAAMAYYINNKIDSEGRIPYANGYYVLKADMNLDARFWQPIGTEENPFNGTFNFSSYGVINITLDKVYQVVHYDGLFGYITENAKFLSNPTDYTTTLIIIVGIIALIIILIIIIVTYILLKRKKMRKLSANSMIAINKIQNMK